LLGSHRIKLLYSGNDFGKSGGSTVIAAERRTLFSLLGLHFSTPVNAGLATWRTLRAADGTRAIAGERSSPFARQECQRHVGAEMANLQIHQRS
jgi:hypothetical protein